MNDGRVIVHGVKTRGYNPNNKIRDLKVQYGFYALF